MGLYDFYTKAKKKIGDTAMSSLGAIAEYFKPTENVRVRDVMREIPKTVSDMYSGTKSVVTKAPKILGEGLAYGLDPNVRKQYLAGNTDILPTITNTTPRSMLADTAKAALEIAPVGKIRATAKFLSAPNAIKRVAGGAGLGYAYDVTDRLSKDENVSSKTFAPGYGTAIGGGVAGVLRPSAAVAKRGIDDAISTGRKIKEAAVEDARTLVGPKPETKRVVYDFGVRGKRTLSDLALGAKDDLMGNMRGFGSSMNRKADDLARVRASNRPASVETIAGEKTYKLPGVLREALPKAGMSIDDEETPHCVGKGYACFP